MSLITVDKMQRYQGPGVRYNDGELALNCVRDVRHFAAYLRRQSAKHPNARCWHSFGWYKDVRGVVSLMIINLSLGEKTPDQPWTKGSSNTRVAKTTRIFENDCPLSELADHIEWYYRFQIRVEQKFEMSAVIESRHRRKEEIRKKKQLLEEQERLVDLECEAKENALKKSHQWQLQDQPEDEEMQDGEAVAGGSPVQSRGQGNAAVTATPATPTAAAVADMAPATAVATAVPGTGAKQVEAPVLVG